MKSSSTTTHKFTYGTYSYDYELERQERKTLSLTVNPDKSIVLKCPNEASDDKVEAFLTRKWGWLEKQLNFFKKANGKSSIKEYVSGESFYYLGRQYKMAVKKAKGDKVALTKGKLLVSTSKSVSDGDNNKKLLNTWFDEKRAKVFSDRFTEMKKLFDFKVMPELGIRKMKARWGSFLSKEKIFLNPKLIHTSKDCIDYVIVHELCHMRYKNHDKKFYSFLDEKYPGWKKVKEKLEHNYK